jgi:hypothetical protein
MKISFFFLLFIAIKSSNAQNYVPFMQGQAAYLYYNPAFAGSTGFHRAAAGIAVSGVQRNFQRAYLSYDQYSTKAKIGFGIFATNIPWYTDFQYKKITYSECEIVAAPKVRISKKLMLSVGISASIGRKSTAKDTVYILKESYIPDQWHLNYSLGAVINAKNYYMGYCLRKYDPVISSRDTNLTNYKITLEQVPVFFSTIQGGLMLKSRKSSFSFNPSFIYQMYHHPQMKSQNTLIVNTNFKYANVFWGIGVGNTNSQITLGYQRQKFRIGYAAGFTYNLFDLFETTNINNGYLFFSREFFISYTFEDFSTKLFTLQPHKSEKEVPEESK